MKKLVSILLTIVLCFNLSCATFAFVDYSEHMSENVEESVTRAEETRWYYREINGVWEKRLWSITYGVWLTDWMPV